MDIVQQCECVRLHYNLCFSKVINISQKKKRKLFFFFRTICICIEENYPVYMIMKMIEKNSRFVITIRNGTHFIFVFSQFCRKYSFDDTQKKHSMKNARFVGIGLRMCVA